MREPRTPWRKAWRGKIVTRKSRRHGAANPLQEPNENKKETTRVPSLIRKPKDTDAAVGMRIRSRRKILGVSQQALGDKLGVSFQQVQKYERGANRVSCSALVAIAEALTISPAVLLGEGSAPLPREEVSFMIHPGADKLVELYPKLSYHNQRLILSLAEQLVRVEDE
jgi:transcriptional regulator with XRE-family HTH domain